MKTIKAADLFCGAGGITGGLKEAAQELGMTVDLLAVNHWEIAIATHKKNHPEAKHLCARVEDVDPWKVVPEKRLDVLVAGPQCTFHSRARGGRPTNDQERVSPWGILDWLEKLHVGAALIENVPEFVNWGPIDPETGRPIERLKGKTFVAYIQAIESLGYTVQHKVINCADYGDATTRQRLFIMARQGKPVRWPVPTHSDPEKTYHNQMQFDHAQTQPWRSARDIIDWNLPGESIYTRQRPLAKNTLRRIYAGLQKHSGLPFVIGQQSNAAPRSVDDPLPTVATAGAISFIQTQLKPFILPPEWIHRGNTARSMDAPMQTITTRGGGHVVTPFLVKFYNTCDAASIDDPLPTVTATGNHLGLCQPYIITLNHGNDSSRAYSIDEPMKTITGVDAWGLTQPYLVKYNGTGKTHSIDEPLPTVTTKDRFGLTQPLVFKVGDDLYMLDILFRMLQPHELAAAMSFPNNYKFHGNRGEVVKQIGNAVPRMTAKALCKALLS